MQSFTARMPLLMATSAIGLGRRRWISQQRYLHFQVSNTHIHTHLFNGRLSGTIQASQYQKGKTNRDFTEARDSEWQWHQLGHMLVCTSLVTDNQASTPPLTFLPAG